MTEFNLSIITHDSYFLVIMLFRGLLYDCILKPVLFSVQRDFQDVIGVGICFEGFFVKVTSDERKCLAVETPRSVNSLSIIRQLMICKHLHIFLWADKS